ncbi:hypothetical protein MMMDOFMJ_2665 [Methylobacterium gnaphalii]|nr:hypothetical protein MMMDOFMJ_2665 [Methylobacterium gnaphalii]
MHRHDADLVAPRFHVALDGVARFAAAGPRHVAGKEGAKARRVAAALEGLGGCEKHVDGIARLAAEPGHQSLAPTERPEQRGVETERPLLGRQSDPDPEHGMPALGGRVSGLRVASECVLQGFRLGAAAGDAHEVVIREPDQRRLESGGERQVVGRQQSGAAGGDKIEHGDMAGDLQAVLTRDRDVERLEGANDFLESRRALAHQDQHIARPPDPAAGIARGRPVAYRARDAAGDEDRGCVGLRRVDGGGPGIGIGLLGRLGDRPKFDGSGRGATRRAVNRADRRVGEGEALKMLRQGKDRVDRPQHAGGGAEGEPQLDILEGEAGIAGGLAPVAPSLLELSWLGTLEAVDRLLRIAHGEARAQGLARAVARREFLRDTAQDLPLLGVRVLRLVDEDVIDAAVELVQHPGHLDPAQQVEGLVDQVVEIEGAEPTFLGLDPSMDLGREQEECAGAGMGPRGSQRVEERDEARLLVDEALAHGLRHAFGAEALSRFVLVGEEDRAVGVQRLCPDTGARRRHEAVGQPLVGDLSGAQARDDGVVAEQAAGQDPLLDGVGRLALREAEALGETGEALLQGMPGIGEEGAPAHRQAERIAQGVATRLRTDDVERHAQVGPVAENGIGQHAVGLCGEGVAGLVLVEHLEAGRHVRLEGEHV